MPLVISPKTYERNIAVFSEELSLKKIPGDRFWHGNFKESFFEGPNGLRAIFPGYNGSVSGRAIIEYASAYLKDDPRPEIYFIGSLYAFRDSPLEVGDLAYAARSYSPDSFEQAIYANAAARGIEKPDSPDPALQSRVLEKSSSLGLDLKPANVYCTMNCGLVPDFTSPFQLLDEGLWWKFSLSPIDEGEFDSGEYESAAVLAVSRLLGIPAVALLDVKDKRLSPSDYRILSSSQREKSLRSLLSLVRESVS